MWQRHLPPGIFQPVADLERESDKEEQNDDACADEERPLAHGANGANEPSNDFPLCGNHQLQKQ